MIEFHRSCGCTVEVGKDCPHHVLVAMRYDDQAKIRSRAAELGVTRDEYIVAAATELTAVALTNAMRRRCEDEIALFLTAMARHTNDEAASQILAIADAIVEGRHISANKDRPTAHDLQRREALDSLIHHLDRWLSEAEWLAGNGITAGKTVRHEVGKNIEKAQRDALDEYKRIRTQASVGAPELRYPAQPITEALARRVGDS